jgi:hypothetical protein
VTAPWADPAHIVASATFGGAPVEPEREAAWAADFQRRLALIQPPALDELERIDDPRDDPAFEIDVRSPAEQMAAHAWSEWQADPRPKPTCVADMLVPSAVDEYVIDGFLRPNVLGMLVAAYGAGKSQIRKSIEIVAATACAPLFGRYVVPEPVAVLTIDEDNGDAEEYRRDDAYLAYYGLERTALRGAYRLSWAALRLETDDGQEWLATMVDHVYAAVGRRRMLLILDPISHMYAVKELREDLLPVYQFLREILRDRPWLTILLVHHLRKAAQGAGWERTLDDVRGGAWGPWLDVIALLSPMGDRRAQLTMHKRVPPSSLILQQTDAGPFEYVADVLERKPSTDDRVMAAIDSGADTVDLLTLALGLAERTIWNAIRRLRKTGLLADGVPLRRPEMDR